MVEMRYLLTPAQRTFKQAVREIVDSETGPLLGGRDGDPGSSERPVDARIEQMVLSLAPGGSAGHTGTLANLESVVALEEIIRGSYRTGRSFTPGRAFGAKPEILRASVSLGIAQGALEACLEIAFTQGSQAPSVHGAGIQSVSDCISEIEAVRLLVYRAAILEDGGKTNPEEEARAESLAAESRIRAIGISDEIKKRSEQ
jgi:alkylation response protein AidB-like acyl-CoA dehydrogenase